MTRKTIFSRIFTIAMALAILMGLLLTPATDRVYADGGPTPTPVPTLDTGNSGASGGGNGGG